MRALTKDQSATRDEFVDRLTSAKEDIDAEHDKVLVAINVLNEMINDYNEILTEAEGFRDEVVAAMDEYIGERSEKWEESDNGQNYTSWKDEWEAIDFAEVDLVEAPDLPDTDHADELAGLQERPE